MLKTSYNTESEIPENLKGAYVQKDGKFVLDQLSDDHPVIVSKTQLLNDKTAAVTKSAGLQTQVESLTADLASAKTSSLPRGHRAVPVADADLLEKLRPLGTPAEIEAKLTEHKDLKEKVAKQELDTHIREVAKVLGYEAEAFVMLENLPPFEIKGEGDKKTVVAKLKDDKGGITEKSAQEFIEANYIPMLPALRATGGVKVHGSRSNGGDPSKNHFDKVREDVKNNEKRSETSLHPMFSKIHGHTEAQKAGDN